MNKTYYICKYTPIEILEAMGADPVLLEDMVDDFSLSDQYAHPNLCGYGKAILELCLRNDIRELVLVSCCDSIRSVYDILRERGNFDFLFMMDILHNDPECSKERMKKEIMRLVREYGDYRKRTFDKEAFLASFSPEMRPSADYISVLGGRVGPELFSMISSTMSLEVKNDTCVHNRFIPRPAEDMDFDSLLAWYSEALLSQIPCMRMSDPIGRRRLFLDEHIKGVIYHTVKFCDYYNFEYSDLRREITVPMLKIESDYTIRSSGQLKTRLEAFNESLSGISEKRGSKMKGKGYFVGIDSGSASTDVVILDKDKNIVSTAVKPTGAGANKGAERALDEALEKAHLTHDDIDAIVTTGYGRGAIEGGNESITEITCHAKGAFFLDPDVRTIIDIGGQDSKVILLDDSGSVVNFVMNDKCAAGTGRFLELMARTLELPLDKMSAIGLDWKEDVVISSMCTVFAESEVVSLIALNKRPEDIVHGLNRAVSSKTYALVKRVGGKEKYMMTGGVSKNKGVATELEKLLSSKLLISDLAQLNGALGAALFALEL